MMVQDASLLLPSVLQTHFQLLAVLADCPEWSPCSEIFLLQRKRDSESCPILPCWGEHPSSDLLAGSQRPGPLLNLGQPLIGYLGSRVSWKVLAVMAPYLKYFFTLSGSLNPFVDNYSPKLSPWFLSHTVYLCSFSYSLVYTVWFSGNKNWRLACNHTSS